MAHTPGAEGEDGHLVFVKGATLMAIPFDSAKLETRGTPVMVLPRLATIPEGSGHFDVADDGTIVYADPPTGDTTARTLLWVDRQGQERPLSPSLPVRPYAQPRISPDGTLVAVTINDQENDLWVWQVAHQAPLRRLTSGPPMDFFAVWTPDSHRLIFGRPGGGLFWQAVDGTGRVEALNTEPGPAMLPSGMTPDGTRVLFSLGPRDVMAMTLDGRRVEPLVQTQFNERNGVVSPDGSWLAYESDSAQRFEIYVTPYPNVKGGTWPVSTAGGTRPLWSPNGQELFFVAPDGAIMAARVDSRGGVWRSGDPMKVIEGEYATGAPASGRNYDVSEDGKLFLMVKQTAGSQAAAAPQIQLVQHWADELKRLVPAAR